MKRLLYLLPLVAIFFTSFAQTPQGMSYQAVVRDSNNELVREGQIGVKINIIHLSATGETVYSETHQITSNINGLVDLVIGFGDPVLGTFENINWSDGPYYLEVQTDPNGGTNYTISGSSQLLSVPYALYAGSSPSELPIEATTGDLLFFDGNEWVVLPGGEHGQLLAFCNGLPTWGPCPDEMAVVTLSADEITEFTAIVGGNVTNEGDWLVLDKGIYWGLNPDVVTTGTKIQGGNGAGEFLILLEDLEPGTTYYFRSYANNFARKVYGAEQTFNTLEQVIDPDGNIYPTIVVGTLEWYAENLRTTKYADGTPIPTENFKVYDHELVDGIDSMEEMIAAYGILYNYAAVTSEEGLCPTGWRVSTDEDWTNYQTAIGDPIGAGNRTKSCRQTVTPLGEPCEITEHPRWTRLLTQYGTDDYGFGALPAGRYTDNFLNIGAHAWFWTESETGVAKRLMNLANDIFTNENTDESHFLSIRCVKDFNPGIINLPEVTTQEVTDITTDSATGGGNVVEEGDSEVIARGVVWSTDSEPDLDNNDGFTVDGSGLGSFTSSITGLTDQTQYFVRAYATNSQGTSYGNEVSFIAGVESGVMDIEGNIYPTVAIGNQQWMAKNLRSATFNDGTAIPLLGNADWAAVNYDNNPSSSYGLYPHESITGLNTDEEVMEAYGLVYNWFAVNNEAGLCPTGWRIPSKEDVDELLVYISEGSYDPEDYLSSTDEGKQLKSCRRVNSPLGGECNTSEHPRWNSHGNIFGNDDHGFAALPAGYRNSSGGYTFIGSMTGFWTSELVQLDEPHGWAARALRMDMANDVIFREYWQPLLGYSVRCIKESNED